MGLTNLQVMAATAHKEGYPGSPIRQEIYEQLIFLYEVLPSWVKLEGVLEQICNTVTLFWSPNVEPNPENIQTLIRLAEQVTPSVEEQEFLKRMICMPEGVADFQYYNAVQSLIFALNDIYLCSMDEMNRSGYLS